MSVWDNWGRGTYNMDSGSWQGPQTAQQKWVADEQARRARATRNEFIRNAVIGTAGVAAGGYGLAALGGAAPAATMASQAAPAATGAATGGTAVLPSAAFGPAAGTFGYAGTVPMAASGITAPVVTSWGAPGGGGPPPVNNASAGGSRMSDFLRYGAGPLIGGATTLIGNSANNRAAREAQAQQAAQFAATQAFLEQQEKNRHDDYLATEAEKKRQFDLTEAEKRRQYDETEAMKTPFREAAKGNLVRMNSLLDLPRPARLDLSWMDRNR